MSLLIVVITDLQWFARLFSQTDLLDDFGLNLHRIEKDVLRCDRNYPYFTHENLDKLRNVISR